MKYVLLALLAIGCVRVPMTKLQFGKLRYSSPLDRSTGEMTIEVYENNSLRIHASKISATNSPIVIATTAEGQVNMIKAGGSIITNVTDTMSKTIK